MDNELPYHGWTNAKRLWAIHWSIWFFGILQLIANAVLIVVVAKR